MGPALLLALAADVSMHPMSASDWMGGTVQVETAAHHAVAVSPSYSVSTVNGSDGHEVTGGAAGCELGWFVYSGRPSESGLWAGPSVLSRPHAYAEGNDIAHRNAVGGSIDVGAQVVTKSGVSVNVDIGLQYFAAELPAEQQAYALPRTIVTVGWKL
jgi:hypothetical protein